MSERSSVVDARKVEIILQCAECSQLFYEIFFHDHFDLHSAISRAIVAPAHWGYIFVVATYGNLNIAFIGKSIVRGIKADPSRVGQIDLSPCMGSLCTYQHVSWAIVKIA